MHKGWRPLAARVQKINSQRPAPAWRLSAQVDRQVRRQGTCQKLSYELQVTSCKFVVIFCLCNKKYYITSNF